MCPRPPEPHTLGVGGYIALVGLWAAPVSGVSMNAARSFGPALDGPAQMHDAYRVDKGGKPTFGRVMKANARKAARRMNRETVNRYRGSAAHAEMEDRAHPVQVRRSSPKSARMG